MPFDDTNKFVKTGALLGMAAFCMGPINHRLGAAAWFIKGAGLFALHELGAKQPGKGTTTNSIHMFFGPRIGDVFGNIIKGGAEVVDFLVPPSKKS